MLWAMIRPSRAQLSQIGEIGVKSAVQFARIQSVPYCQCLGSRAARDCAMRVIEAFPLGRPARSVDPYATWLGQP
eukprot:11767021-Alexandrium_andersonii.AAC.1